jgi:hypothetical protein
MVMSPKSVVREELSREQKMDFRVDADFRHCREDVREIANLIIQIKKLEARESYLLEAMDGIALSEQQLQALKEQETAAEQQWYFKKKYVQWQIRKEREAVNRQLDRLRQDTADINELIKIRAEIRVLDQRIDKLSYDMKRLLEDTRYCILFEQGHLTQIENQIRKEEAGVVNQNVSAGRWTGESKTGRSFVDFT